jgi:putative Mg2+ transporter-C (MgtC) family protein
MELHLALAISFVLSLLVGMERQLSRKPVGFAPYVLVTVMSTALTSVAAIVYVDNPAVVNGILMGIGFLGAGALIKAHDRVFGFTTASAIWAMAAFGVLVAIADVPAIIGAYSVVWATILIDRLIESRGLSRHTRTIMVEAKGVGSHADIKETLNRHTDSKEEGIEMNFDRGVVEYKFAVKDGPGADRLVEELSKLKGVRRIQMD